MPSHFAAAGARLLALCRRPGRAASPTPPHSEQQHRTPPPPGAIRNRELLEPAVGSLYIPECDKSLKPAIGMTFDDIESAKEFYTAYAAHAGFPVCVGQHKAKNGLVMNKRFYCSREAFRKAKDETQA
ncbi:hypothetical protein U9M48_037609 [Paspalum notatum var. saurae]|uniref:FAR1 domain-containing protein n=1 Tax=Paspalum notatum var. saurae TaxID=547442 RepID=A0AAQ3UFY6_PASNO